MSHVWTCSTHTHTQVCAHSLDVRSNLAVNFFVLIVLIYFTQCACVLCAFGLWCWCFLVFFFFLGFIFEGLVLGRSSRKVFQGFWLIWVFEGYAYCWCVFFFTVLNLSIVFFFFIVVLGVFLCVKGCLVLGCVFGCFCFFVVVFFFFFFFSFFWCVCVLFFFFLFVCLGLIFFDFE